MQEDFKPCSYEIAREALIGSILKIPTLGGLAEIEVSYKICITILNAAGNEYLVDRQLWKVIADRVNSLTDIEERNKTGSYTDPNWPDCPNRITSPYVVALMKFLYSQGSSNL